MEILKRTLVRCLAHLWGFDKAEHGERRTLTHRVEATFQVPMLHPRHLPK
jgi:hypothetical protein